MQKLPSVAYLPQSSTRLIGCRWICPHGDVLPLIINYVSQQVSFALNQEVEFEIDRYEEEAS